jgi:hypothetical protein
MKGKIRRILQNLQEFSVHSPSVLLHDRLSNSHSHYSSFPLTTQLR